MHVLEVVFRRRVSPRTLALSSTFNPEPMPITLGHIISYVGRCTVGLVLDRHSCALGGSDSTVKLVKVPWNSPVEFP